MGTNHAGISNTFLSIGVGMCIIVYNYRCFCIDIIRVFEQCSDKKGFNDLL